MSGLAIVGRDYGWQEVAAGGVPFVGEAGRLLNEALKDAGIERSACLITNVVNKRPPRDEWGAHAQEDIDWGMGCLGDTLGAHHPRLIVALGTQALYACATGQAPPRSEGVLERAVVAHFGARITELRGYVWPGPWAPVLAAVHPAFVLRTWLPWRAALTWDFQKAARLAGLTNGRQTEEVSQGDAVSSPSQRRQSLYCRSREEAQQYVATLRSASTLACDTEHDGQTLACAAFSADSTRGVTFVLPRDRKCVAELLATPAEKVWMNAQSDLTVLKRNGYEVAGEQHDVMLLFHALHPLVAGRSGDGASGAGRKRLAFLASIYTDEPFWKNYAFESEEERYTLCATDSRVTLKVWERLLAQMTTQQSQQ